MDSKILLLTELGQFTVTPFFPAENEATEKAPPSGHKTLINRSQLPQDYKASPEMGVPF